MHHHLPLNETNESELDLMTNLLPQQNTSLPIELSIPTGMEMRAVQGPPDQPAMSMPVSMSQNISLEIGEVAFLLGSNGSGKSSLLMHLRRSVGDRAQTIVAYRQMFFSNRNIGMSAAMKQQNDDQFRGQLNNDHSRWNINNPAAMPDSAISSLLNAQNKYNAEAARIVHSNDVTGLSNFRQTVSPIGKVNALLLSSNINITLSEDPIVGLLASKSGSPPFSAAEMSDGERSALYIAAEILSAKEGTVFFLDEPERHLHPSISAPLLRSLVQERSDCIFVIATHELALATGFENAKIVLVRGAYPTNNEMGTQRSWKVTVLESNMSVPEDLRRDLLGARNRIVFVEGTQASLDADLYALVFPDASVIPKGSCRDVESAVTSVRSTEDLHWVAVFGIVDSDGRQAAELEPLKKRGIFAVPAYSVESIYYHPHIISMVAHRLAEVSGEQAPSLIENAKQKAVAEISKSREVLCARVIEKSIRHGALAQLPDWKAIQKGNPLEIKLDLQGAMDAEVAAFDAAIKRLDIEFLISRYPIRETGLRDMIAKLIGSKNKEAYQQSVRKLLSDDADALAFVRGLFGELSQALTE